MTLTSISDALACFSACLSFRLEFHGHQEVVNTVSPTTVLNNVDLGACMFTCLDMVGCTAFVYEADDSFSNENDCILYDSQSLDYVYTYRTYTHTLICLEGNLRNFTIY